MIPLQKLIKEKTRKKKQKTIKSTNKSYATISSPSNLSLKLGREVCKKKNAS